MKGVSNYLCLRRFDEHATRQASLGRATPSSTRDARVWAASTETGDRAELPDARRRPPLWREVVADAGDAHRRALPVLRALLRDAARAGAPTRPTLIIVNHHLFFADLALRAAWPEAQVLPPYEVVIFDEAHQLEDVATELLRRRASRRCGCSRWCATLTRAVGATGTRPTRRRRRSAHVRRCAPMRCSTRCAAAPRRDEARVRRRRDLVGRAAQQALATRSTSCSRSSRPAARGTRARRELADGGNEAGGARAARARRCATIWRCSSTARGTIARHVCWAEARGRTVLPARVARRRRRAPARALARRRSRPRSSPRRR